MVRHQNHDSTLIISRDIAKIRLVRHGQKRSEMLNDVLIRFLDPKNILLDTKIMILH